MEEEANPTSSAASSDPVYQPQALYEPEPAPARQPYPPPPPKKKSRTGILIGGGFVGLILLALAINSGGGEQTYNYPEDTSLAETQQVISELEEPSANPNVKAVPPPATSNAQLILGGWQFMEASSDDPNADLFLSLYDDMQATYTFYQNGQVQSISPFGNSTFYYQVDGNQLAIPGDINTATILQLDQQHLVIKAFFNYEGYVYPVTYNFRRMD